MDALVKQSALLVVGISMVLWCYGAVVVSEAGDRLFSSVLTTADTEGLPPPATRHRDDIRHNQ